MPPLFSLAKPFRIAAARGQLAKLAAIYSQAPHVLNSKDEQTGTTALHEAIKKGFAEPAVFLCQAHNIELLKDRQGKDPFDYIYNNRFYSLYDVLKKSFPLPNNLLFDKFMKSTLQEKILALESAEKQKLTPIGDPNKIGQELTSIVSLHDWERWMIKHSIKNHPHFMVNGDSLYRLGIYYNPFLPSRELVKLLLTYKIDINTCNQLHSPRGFEANLFHTLLANESYEEFEDILRLASDNADLTVADGEGKTPLHIAVKLRQPKMVKLILNTMKDRGLTHEKIAQLINQVDRYGTPLIQVAYILGSQEIVELLIEHGADVAIKDKRGASLDEIIEKEEELNLRAHLLLALIHVDSRRDASALTNEISVVNKPKGFFTLQFLGERKFWDKTGHEKILKKLASGDVPDGILYNPYLLGNPAQLSAYINHLISALKSIPMQGKSLVTACEEGRADIRSCPTLMKHLKRDAIFSFPPRPYSLQSYPVF